MALQQARVDENREKMKKVSCKPQTNVSRALPLSPLYFPNFQLSVDI
jgi:hypothetical protein